MIESKIYAFQPHFAAKKSLGKLSKKAQHIYQKARRGAMHKTLLILVVLLLLQPGAAAAGVANTPFEQRCERDMKPQLHVTSRDEGYQIMLS